MLFFITLTVMLGAMFKKRGGVIGIGLGVLFGQQYLIGGLPFLGQVLPWGLVLPLGDEFKSSVAGAILSGQSPSTWTPVISVSVMSVAFAVIAVYRFRSVEL